MVANDTLKGRVHRNGCETLIKLHPQLHNSKFTINAKNIYSLSVMNDKNYL